jgi:hypothetical protein
MGFVPEPIVPMKDMRVTPPWPFTTVVKSGELCTTFKTVLGKPARMVRSVLRPLIGGRFASVTVTFAFMLGVTKEGHLGHPLGQGLGGDDRRRRVGQSERNRVVQGDGVEEFVDQRMVAVTGSPAVGETAAEDE